MNRKGKSRLDWTLVTILTAVGLGLRLAYLLEVPPFLDEYSSILTGMSILHTSGIPRLPSGVLYPSGSLFSYLEAAFIAVGGYNDMVARLPSLLISGLTLPVLFVVARNMLNRRVALLSVALLALAPEAIVWGARARMYALLQFLALLAIYFFYRSVLDKESRSTFAWPWVICFVAAIFTQDEAILLLPVLWLAALIVRGVRWFLQARVLLWQVFLPVAGVAIRYWLHQIRVPGEVYTGIHSAFFRFPPALAHGVKGLAPFYTAPWALPLALCFLVALGLLGRDYYISRVKHGISGFVAPTFLAYIVLTITAAIVLVVNTPWQDDRYLFMVLPQFLMVAAWGLDRVLGAMARRWPMLDSKWATLMLVVIVACALSPAGLSTLHRFEPDYSAAYRWIASQLANDDLVTTMRPAPAAVYLGRCDFLVAEDKHQEFIMRLDGVWVDRWAGAKVLESPDAFRDEALKSGQRVWFVIDENRFESVAYSPEFVTLVLGQMDLVWRGGGVLVFQGQGYHPPPDMAVTKTLNANFGEQLRLTGYGLSTDHPEPGQEVTLQLYWQATQPERNYTVFVHITAADGRGLTQVDGEPLLGLYSMTTHWPRDRAVVDERQLTIPSDVSPGRYRLEVGLYDVNDPKATPLPLLDASGNDVASSLTLDFLYVNMVPPPEPPQLVTESNLADKVRLEGYDLPQREAEAGTTLPLTLTWKCLGTFAEDYTVFVHLASADRQPVAQVDSKPLGGTYPTRFWEVGERLVDPYFLQVPAGTSPGTYDLLVGMYLLATDERLPLLGMDGQELGDSISLGQVTVVGP